MTTDSVFYGLDTLDEISLYRLARDLFRALDREAPETLGQVLVDSGWVKEEALTEVMEQRDEYEEMCDSLAASIGRLTGEDVGEHSSANNPWLKALEIAESQPREAGHSAWFSLAECDFQICPCGIFSRAYRNVDPEALGVFLIKHGPGKVRVKKR